jgi:hypothetical protein
VCSAMLIYGANVTKINQPRTNTADANERRKYKLSRIILETLDARTDAGLTNLKQSNHKIDETAKTFHTKRLWSSWKALKLPCRSACMNFRI